MGNRETEAEAETETKRHYSMDGWMGGFRVSQSESAGCAELRCTPPALPV